MSVLLIAGSPTSPSRSALLLDAVDARLLALGVATRRITVRDLPAQALLHADFSNPELSDAFALVREAEAVVLATPIYKAAYSGALKMFLDLLPQTALEHKTVLPLATGGSANHMLAIDYALRPVLQALGARHVLSGVYATDSQVNVDDVSGVAIDSDIELRLDASVHAIAASLHWPVLKATALAAEARSRLGAHRVIAPATDRCRV